MRGRRIARWLIYAACAIPLLLLAQVVAVAVLPDARFDGAASVRGVAILLLWGGAMLGVWVGLGRMLRVG